MAEKINLREKEYQAVIAEMQKMHQEQINAITTVINQMRTLVTREDCFSANLTSKKMMEMLDTISGNIVKPMQQAFQNSETAMTNMITNVIETDKA